MQQRENHLSASLSAFGFSAWFADHAREICAADQTLARVVAIDRGRITLNAGDGEFFAELLGKFFYAAESAAKFPCVGDWVCVEHHDGDAFATVHAILPRRTLLKRKTVGYDEEFQMLAANIDVALIVMACNYDFHLAKLERFLVMVHEAHIKPVLLLTKTDLITPDQLQQLKAEISAAGFNIEILPVSNSTGAGVDQLRLLMRPETTYCLLGSSGVGKSSLMNALLGEEAFATQAVSDSGQGRHTTVRRHLIKLDTGALVVDMPGMRELAIAEVKEGIEESFADIVALTEQCKFSNCSHNSEPGCAILAALESGELSHDHYKNYLKIQKEARHHKKSDSYVEKRRKAKNASRIAPTKTRNKKQRLSDEELRGDST